MGRHLGPPIEELPNRSDPLRTKDHVPAGRQRRSGRLSYI